MTAEMLDRPIAFQRAYVRLGLGITGALMLSQAVYWSSRTKGQDGWFYKDQREWEEETGLSRREQETARKRLIEAGFLREQRKGVPCRLFYQVNLDALNSALRDLAQNVQTSMSESANLDCTKAPNSNGETSPTITEITAEITADIKPACPPETEKQKSKGRKPQPETLITDYIQDCKIRGVKTIPRGHAVFEYAEKAGIPSDFMLLAWKVFRDEMAAKQKKQRDWPATFRNYVEKDWVKIWGISGEGEYYLNTKGKQADIMYRATA